jgi:3,4-dihydroxy 2-butanone 4-phosphate synthase/GTP cyclohydrolase II
MTLADYLKETGTTRAAFARAIGVRHISVTRYLAGRIPERRVMERIAMATGCKVTANDFFGIAA